MNNFTLLEDNKRNSVGSSEIYRAKELNCPEVGQFPPPGLLQTLMALKPSYCAVDKSSVLSKWKRKLLQANKIGNLI